jgi:hypothetical protein
MAKSITAVLVLGLLTASTESAQVAAPRPPLPQDPITAIVNAFSTHDVVAIGDPHGSVQMQAFLLSLVRDPRFAAAAPDIVIETLSARYQDLIDRFVRGEDVPPAMLRRAGEDHSVATNMGFQGEELVRAVRALNASLTGRKLRVIAGDPPIDWDNIVSEDDHRRWIELRDTYPADLIRRQVLDRGRRALVVYGQMHLQRRHITSNYDMSTWQAQTIVSLLERDARARIFNVWTILDRSIATPAEVASWPAPRLAILQGTTLGAMDFGALTAGIGGGRVAVTDTGFVPIPKQDWKAMRLEDQFTALLYLGPPSSMTYATIPVEYCRDKAFVARRLQRLARGVPPFEIENFKKACGVP